MPSPSVPLNAIRQPAILYDVEGRIVAANDLAESTAGRPLVGLSAADVVRIFRHRHPDGTPIAPAELPACRALAGREVVEVPLAITLADGLTLEIVATASPIRGGDAVTGALVVWQDVSALVAAEKGLRESEERFRLALWNAPTAVFHQDRDLRYTWYGHPHPLFAGTDLLGRTDADLMAPEDAAPITALKAEVLATGEARRGEVSVTVDGVTMYADLAIEPVRDADGRTVGVMGVSHDITELKRAEAALRESEERQAFLLRLSDATRSLADAGAIQAAASRALGEHLGADRVLYGELAPDGERITVEHGYAEGVDTWTCSMQTTEFGTGFMQALRAGRNLLVSDTARDDRMPAGARAAFAAAEVRSLAAVPLVKGGRLEAVLLVQQSRPREWTPAEVAQIEETAERTWAAVERARAEAALKRYAERLATSNEELQRFAYVASHDLQEPLRSVISFSQLLERKYRGKLDSDADDYIGFIVDGGNRMQRLIRDLLTFSRVETMAGEPVPVDAGRAVADALVTFNDQVRELGGTVTVGPLPTVCADPRQVEQVFSNLISNAIKYRRESVPLEVRIAAERTNGMWEFSVADNGIGIEAEYFDRIFVIFQRLHTHDKYDGTGIGLAVVKRIVERYGGRIRVESTPGEGTTFYFILPAA